jgi:hypothetical protein
MRQPRDRTARSVVTDQNRIRQPDNVASQCDPNRNGRIEIRETGLGEQMLTGKGVLVVEQCIDVSHALLSEKPAESVPEGTNLRVNCRTVHTSEICINI